MKKSKLNKLYLPLGMMLLGVLLCLLPLVLRLVSRQETVDFISSYTSEMKSIEDDICDDAFKEAKAYNEMLYQTQNVYIQGISDVILTSEHYQSLLNVLENGVMGSIEIPKINVKLPIFHGTNEAALSNGVGHVEGTSLPIGGNNTRAILSGHRGLASAELFSRLDELEVGDLFYLHVLNKTLAYQVTSIEVLTPEQAQRQKMIPNKDCVTLMTCTPHSLNTHRLFVNGEAIKYEPKEQTILKLQMPQEPKELAIYIVPIMAILMVLGILMNEKKRREK